MKYSVLNLGCKVNRVESDHFERMFHSRALVPSDPGDADIIIVNTCTVTGDAEKKARKLARSLYAQMIERISSSPGAPVRLRQMYSKRCPSASLLFLSTISMHI